MLTIAVAIHKMNRFTVEMDQTQACFTMASGVHGVSLLTGEERDRKPFCPIRNGRLPRGPDLWRIVDAPSHLGSYIDIQF